MNAIKDDIQTINIDKPIGPQELNLKTQITKRNINICSKKFTIENKNLAFIILCMCVFLQNSIIGGSNYAILSTIERAYYMTSFESAIFLSLYDVSNILVSPIIGYYSDRLFKPRIIAICILGLSFGSLVMLLPHIILNQLVLFNKLELNNTENRDLLCDISNAIKLNNTIGTKLYLDNILINNMKYFFYFSNLINGAFSVGLYTTVISFFENIFSSEQVNIRQGVYYAIGAFGIGFGMLITGVFLNVNGLIHQEVNDQYNSNSINWIGELYFLTFIQLF